ncbi:MAG: HlyD family secretion protein [Methanomassiliicoccaceae archaeon]|nr:HlyD family secretion protein [Methanomassiliicoccaceae archaeon]
MTILVLIVFVSMIVAVAVAASEQKSESIHSVGIIQSDSKHYIMSPYGGEISKINVEEGQFVKNGDRLITVGATESEAQLEIYTNLTNYYYGILNGYYKMYNKIERYDITKDIRTCYANENPFYANTERTMYISYEAFLRQMAGVTDDGVNTLRENRQLYIDQSLMSCNQMIMQYEPTYMQLIYQKESFQTIVNDHTIVAKSDGVIHFETALNKGMVVSSGALLLSISGEAVDDGVSVILHIPAAYRPYVSKDCLIQMEVAGYPSATYGKLNGKVTIISSDSTVDSNGNVWFTVTVEAEATLNGKAGSVQVVNGMMVSASIIYSESTWLEWFLKGLGFK